MPFQLSDLRVPLIQAPMAGGPTTPELAAAVIRAGGLGFLAAGYLAPEALRTQIARLRKLAGDGAAFGVNVFVPQPVAQPELVAAYRARLLAEAAAHGIDDLPEPDLADTDHWPEKLDLLAADPVPVVSFTFGLPEPQVIAGLRSQGTYTIGTVTSAEEAVQAVGAGVDALCVQGPEAGGHRGVFDPSIAPPTTPLTALLHEVRAATSPSPHLPIIAAGGIASSAAVALLLNNGLADAVQLGTGFLRADEAATNPLHRKALADPSYPETVVTRAFSGRWARALRTRFIDAHPDAPAAYPAINQLTKPLRAAAAARGDASGLSLYAGTGHRLAQGAPAAEIIKAMTADL
ncbi:MAG TPA: nitronate monooxygenase [Actinospica sp.]|nr:nitronate monooxygenase [Actinospica sp.]